MGAFLMVGYPMLFWKLNSAALKRKQLLVVTLIIVAVLLHVLTGSRATFLAAIAGSAVWLVARKKTSLLMLTSSVVGILVFAGFVTLGLDTIKPESFHRGKHSSGITDLKGRPELWAGSLYMVNGRPFTGYGFGVEGRIWNDRRFLDPELTLWSGSAKSSLHNGYLAIAVGLGWTGLVLWLLTVLIPIWSLRHLKVDHCVAAILATTSTCLLVNLVEGAISGSRSVTSLTFWIMWAIAIQLTRRNSPFTALRTV
jgi:O-antigen ligase